MSTSFDEDDIQLSSSDELRVAPNMSLFNSLVTAAKLPDKQPPQLIDFAHQNREIQATAESLHQLFSAPGIVNYSQEARQDLELVIRSFVSSCIEAHDANNNEFGDDGEKSKKADDDELFEVKKELEQVKASLRAKEKEAEDLANETKEQRAEINKLYEDSANALQKVNASRRDYEDKIAELKTQNDQLNDQLREALDKLKIKEYTEQRNQEQFSEMSSNVASFNSQVLKLKDKINTKNEKIQELEEKLQEMTVNIQSLEDDNQKLAVYLNSTKSKLNESKKIINKFNSGHLTGLQQDNERLKNSFSAITKQFEAQSQELIELRTSFVSATTLLHKQIELIAEYEKLCDSLSEAKENCYNLSNQLNLLKGQYLQKNERYETIDNIMKNIMSLTNCNNPEEVPMQILKMKDFGCLENQRLVAAFEDQVRFMATLVNSDIYYGKGNKPLNEDPSFTEKLQIEMSRCRKFIEDNTVEKPEDMDEEDEEQYKFELTSREDFAILSTQVMRNEILRKYSEELKRDSDTLNKIAELYEYTEDPQALPDYLSARNQQLQNFFDQVEKTVELKENPYEDILEYIETTKSILDEITKVAKVDGDVNELPDQIEKLIRQTTNSSILNNNKSGFNNRSQNSSNNTSMEEDDLTDTFVLKMQSQRESEMAKQIEDLTESFNNQTLKSQATIEQLQKKTDELQASKKKLTQERKKLAEQLLEARKLNEELNERESKHNKTLSTMSANYKDLEEETADLKAKNEELRNEISKRQKASDERLDKILKEERDHHQAEIKSIQQRFDTMVERQNDNLEKKNQRIKAYKKRLNEVISSYENAFKKQKDIIRLLRNKTEKCVNKTDEIVSSKDETLLENELSVVRSERDALKAKVSQLDSQLSKAQAVRDTFWKSQIAMVENNTKIEVERAVNQTLEKIAEPIHCEPTIDCIINAFEQRETRDFSVALNSIDTSSLKQLEEWEKWSRQLFSNINHGEIFSHSSRELRFIIGEMALSSISNHVLISRLESLRQQKIMLLTGKICNKTNEPPEIRSLLIFVICLIRLRRRARQITPAFFQASLPIVA